MITKFLKQRAFFILAAIVLFECLSIHVIAQHQNKQEIKLTESYSDISPLGRYMYDSIFYESARTQSDFEYATFTYQSDEVDVEANLCEPRSLGDKKWPVIIYNRGGTGNFGKLTNEIFPYFYELAREGFIVVGTNYRFVNENGKYDELGGSDVKDVIQLVELVKSWPKADTANLFMMGISRGGLMTYRAARDLKLNAVAVIGGVANSKSGYEKRPIFLDGWDDLSPEENYLGLRNILPDFEANKDQYFYERSPVQWADQIQCPVLILHSRQDGRVTVDQAMEMALALEEADKPYQLKIYNNKSHGLPSHAFDSVEETIKWFKEHMK
ncbi:MAG: prolyl oligopeptidase family serine peptidase [Fulvivirga sp.]